MIAVAATTRGSVFLFEVPVSRDTRIALHKGIIANLALLDFFFRWFCSKEYFVVTHNFISCKPSGGSVLP